MTRFLGAAAIFCCMGGYAIAGTAEERFVEDLVEQFVRVAEPDARSSEVSAFHRILSERLDIEVVTRLVFGEHYERMSGSEVDEAESIILRGAARSLAEALSGRESFEVSGSVDNEVVLVQTVVSAPFDGLRGGLPVVWSIDRDLGLNKFFDVDVQGRSFVAVQRSFVDQMFEISQGNVRSVLVGLREIE